MQEVKVFLHDDGYLVLEKPDGTQLVASVYNGGGYVTQLNFNPIVVDKVTEVSHDTE